MRARSLELRAGRALIALAMFAAPLGAQRQQSAAPPPPAALSEEAAAAYEDLSPRFATESGLIQGWFRDRNVLYYDFGSVPLDAKPAQVFWPIHGFDARGNPVSMRGQRPIFSTIPGLTGYSGVFHLIYVVVADHVQPNYARDVATVTNLVAAKKAHLRETQMLLNLPIVPRGTRLARDSTTGLAGWYQGRDVQFFDFGGVSTAPAPMWRFATPGDTARLPMVLEAQDGLLDSIPVAPPYPDLWDIRFVRPDTSYVPNSIRSAAALRTSTLRVDSAVMIRNLPVVIIDGAPIARAPSPLRAFADLRSPFPPAFTRPQL